MSDDSCPCCGPDPERASDEDRHDFERWVPDAPVLDAGLPRSLRVALGRFLGTRPVDTLGEWAAAVRQHTDGDAITIDELCRTEEVTLHWGVLDGRREYFACFYDAVILAALADRPVDIRTESPTGTVVCAHAVGTQSLLVTPPDAVFSFGIDEAVEPPDDKPTLERGYAAICPYVRAFPNRDAYERWARGVPAATVGLPLAGATDLAAALVE